MTASVDRPELGLAASASGMRHLTTHVYDVIALVGAVIILVISTITIKSLFEPLIAPLEPSWLRIAARTGTFCRSSRSEALQCEGGAAGVAKAERR